MAQPYVGEIRMFAGNFQPAGWLFCEGQLLPISENEVLFNLIGTTYGGDGESVFALPDLRGRVPVHQGNGRILSEMGGAESVTLRVEEIPSHTHVFVASSNIANVPSPENAVLGVSTKANIFFSDPPKTTMNANSLTPAGGHEAHNNFQPYLCVNFIISLFGIFPSPT